MNDLNNNKPAFNLPSYIQTPLFLYQDDRLEKPAMLIASFFYSLHTAGQKLTASTDYLCQLATIKKRQLYKILNQLENYQYISRSGFTNRKKLQWVYCPESSITVVESDTSALKRTSEQKLDASALQNTKLVHSSALNYCTPVHTYTKEDTKDNKKLTTREPTTSSSSFLFSETTDRNLLNQKLTRDVRTDKEFMAECLDHVENCSDKKFPVLQRANALVKLLKQLKEANVIFREPAASEQKKNKSFASETDEQRKERQFFTYEIVKEHDDPSYISQALEKFPEMRGKYQSYAR